MHNKNDNTGFIPSAAGLTLVEVVIAMALLILSLTAFTVSFVQSRRSVAIADNRLEAIRIARQQMETICSSNYSVIVSSGVYTNKGLSPPYTIYTGSNTVNNNPTNGVKDIVVTISWVNPPGKATSTVSLAGSISSELHQ